MIDSLREYIGLDDVVPLLTILDLPSNKLHVMEDGAEITEDSVKVFVNDFLSGRLPSTKLQNNANKAIHIIPKP